MKFIKQLFRRPRETGAIAPSSRSLAKKIVGQINFEQATHIVELGPGTGVITDELLSRLKPGTRLTLIETNDEFVADLMNRNDARLRVFHAKAQDVERFVDAADYIVSGVPIGCAKDEDCNGIIGAVANIPGLKRFIQFQYTRRREKQLSQHFTLQRKWVFLNIPPAHVYVCTPKSTKVASADEKQ